MPGSATLCATAPRPAVASNLVGSIPGLKIGIGAGTADHDAYKAAGLDPVILQGEGAPAALRVADWTQVDQTALRGDAKPTSR